MIQYGYILVISTLTLNFKISAAFICIRAKRRNYQKCNRSCWQLHRYFIADQKRTFRIWAIFESPFWKIQHWWIHHIFSRIYSPKNISKTFGKTHVFKKKKFVHLILTFFFNNFLMFQFCLKEPVKRVLALTETCLVERDPATYNIATLKPLGEVSFIKMRFLSIDKFLF